MLIRFAAAIVCMTFAACVHASMSCFVHPGGVSNAPADGDTLCWADVELPKSAVVIEKEVGGLAYMCDPIWYGCSAFSGFEAGRAGPGGWSPGFFTIDVQIRATPQDPCCFGKTYKFTYDANAKPRPPLVDLGKNSGPPSCPIRAGNPIHVGTGNNYNSERDYLGSGVFPLKFERHYNSILGIQSRRDGWRWKHTYDRAVFLDDSTAIVLRETGRALYFNQAGTDWLGDSDVPGRLERLSAGWQYVDENDFVEIYDIDGKLLSITTRAGFTQILAYDVSDRLSSVTDHFGRALLFGYDAAGDLITVTDPAGAVYSYAYNDRGNLARVTYPDETPSDPGDNPTRQYHYDDPTHPDALTGITNENGVMYVTWGYDVVGRVIANSRAGGADAVTLAYDDAAGTTTLTDALGEVRTYSFETSHNSVRVSAVSGAPCTSSCSNSFATYTYDANGYPASRTDHNGNLTTFIYDARGLETSRTEAVGTAEARTITSRWHPTYRLPELITEPGKTTVFSYDAQGRLLSQTETDTASGRSRTVINTYNTQGLLATTDGPRTDVTDLSTYNYDTEGNLTEIVNALGHVNRVTLHDAHGRPLALQDSNGLVTTRTYDARGRLLGRDIGGQLTRFEYDGVGNVIETTLPDGSFLASEYDDAQRLIAIEDNLGNRTEFALDPAGNWIAETVRDPAGSITRTRSRVFNALNRLVRDIGGAGQQTDFEYDPQGNGTAVIDGNGARTTNEYDALNRLARTIDPESGETDFDYDARDNLVSVIDAEGLTTRYTFDGLDNLIVQSSPDTGVTQFTFDDAGNRLSQTDARGVLTKYEYDALNRLTSVQYPESAKHIGYVYDAGPNGIGRLIRMTDASGNTEFTYDIRGNLLTETRTIDGMDYQTAYAYDSADRLQSITYPSGTVVSYTRDALGRIDSVSATMGGVTQTLASNIVYMPFGPMQSFEYGNGIQMSRTFDQDYRLTTQTATGVQDLGLDYDPANNIISLIDGLDSTRSQSFAYDGLNRLTHAEGIYGTEDYSYDRIGNRLTHSTPAGVDSYSYVPGTHRLDAITGPNATSFSYDTNGNTIARGPLSFTYDDTNRMTEALASGVQLASYTYNGKGERVKKAGPETAAIAGETELFSDDFSGPDGTVIDDQPGGAWRGKRPVVDTSATIEAGTANVLPGQVIRTIETFEDTGDSTLVVRATISQGTLIFKKPGLPHGVKVRFNGKRRVAITAGVFNDDTRRTKLVLQLLDFSDYVSIEIQLNAGVIRGAVTDDQGGAHEIGDISNDVFVAGETYRLKLRAIKVQDIFVPGIFDNLQVDRYSGVDPNLSIHFVYDQDRGLIGEYDSAGIPLADYVHLSGQPIAVLRGSSVRYHHADHLGTSKSLTDDSQNIVWGADYTPFGETIIIERVAENSLRYPGQYFDAETGLHYNYFRDYDPSVGRYGQSDPIGLRGGVNTYVYVEQNPIRYTDRFGLHHDGKGCVDGVGRPVSCPRDVCATAECAARVLPNPSTFCERECAIIASGVSSSVSFPGTKQLMKSSGKLVGGFVGQLLVDPLISIQAYQSCVQSRCQSQGPLCLPDQFTGS